MGPPAPAPSKNGPRVVAGKMTSMPGYGVGSGNYGAGSGREPGARRRKLAAMAGNMYRAGATAVNEIRESYNQTRASEIDSAEASKITIPGSFPDVAIISKGDEQMVLFPSYAKRHVRMQDRQFEEPGGPPRASTVNMDDHEYWREEWARHEDEKAIVDVDIRGWIYNPHRGPITRRNRMMIGLARQLSGIPAPNSQQAESSYPSPHQQHEELREQQRIAERAQEIERRGQAEEEAAQRGNYSDPRLYADEEDNWSGQRGRDSSSPSPARPSPPARTNTTSTMGSGQMTEAELAVANANLMARIAPFMTTPLVQVPITLFFYNDVQSQSRTVMTNDSGHFITRAALDFVPTHVRVLASEHISCTEPVQIIEPKGVSLITDIDDTIKHSNILLGAKEIFRNTFVRDLNDMVIDGVRDWYGTLHDMGVKLHYCSNSPWQLYPVLATFFKRAGLPPGSLHLKQYSGMLQGIFEPVAERKKGTLEKIMYDFPERRFLLIGDSGEADLEVYTELSVAYPGRIVAVFIRDVTTPEQTGYFDSGFRVEGDNMQRRQTYRSEQGQSQNQSREAQKPALPPRLPPRTTNNEGPLMGDLIDLSEEPEAVGPTESSRSSGPTPQTEDPSSCKKPPPPRPSKPTSLRSSPAVPVTKEATTSELPERKKPPPPPAARKPTSGGSGPSTPQSSTLSVNQLSKTRSELALPSLAHESRSTTPTPVSQGRSRSAAAAFVPPPPPPRRRGTPSNIASRSSPRLRASDSNLSASSSRPGPSLAQQGRTNTYASMGESAQAAGGPVDKRVDLWRRRLERAHDTLDRQGVRLYTWRRGDEVIEEAVGIVKAELKAMGVSPAASRKG